MCRKGTQNPRIIYRNTNTSVVYRVSAGGFLDEGRHFNNNDQLKDIITEIRKDPRTFKGCVKRDYEHTTQEHSQFLTIIPKEQQTINETPFHPEDFQTPDTFEYTSDDMSLSLETEFPYSPNFGDISADNLFGC